MKEKLVKDFNNYHLLIDGELHASTDDNVIGKKKLSLKNCESIVNDFDLYGEAVDYAARQGHPSPEGFSDEQVGLLHGYIDGYEQAIKNFGDKKFSEQDINYALHQLHKVSKGERNGDLTFIHFLNESLQQTEWDVEILMEIYDDPDFIEDLNKEMRLTPKILKKPKLDNEGCLILKRI
jgi:hypothetical protein